MNKNRNVILWLIGMALLAAVPAQAQEEWNYAAFAYLWGSGLDGEVAARNRSVEIDQGFGDILENLEFGFAGGVRAFNGQWSVTGDFVYMGLGATVSGPLGNPIEVDVDQIMFGADVGYVVAPSVEVLGGARIVSLQNKLQFSGPGEREFEADKTWVDPIIGIRLSPQLSDRVVFLTRLDLGGFDVGSDFTWQLNANVIWQATETIGLSAGYRVLDMKYDDEEGDEDFVYDVTSHGPILGLVMSF